MASSIEIYEDNGAPTGNPKKGTTRNRITSVWYQSVDSHNRDNAARITVGNNSFTKYISYKFTGSFNEISNVKITRGSGAMPSGTSLKLKTSDAYEQPTASTMAGGTDFTSSGQASVNLSTQSPESNSKTNTLSTTGYTEFIVSQVQTTTSASQGITENVVLRLTWDES